jgi:hypothetical protein
MLGRTSVTIFSIVGVFVRRTCEAIAFVALSFWATRIVTIAFITSIIGRASESVVIIFAPTRRASKAVAFKLAAVLTTREAFASVPTTLGRAGEALAIETVTRRWAAGESAIFAATCVKSGAHRWPGRPASLEACVSGRFTWSATFGTRTVRTSRSAGPPHVLVNGFGHFHEFVFAEFTVFVLIEFGEHLGWVRRVRTTASFWAASACLTAFFSLAFFALTAHLAHFLFGFGAF